MYVYDTNRNNDNEYNVIVFEWRVSCRFVVEISLTTNTFTSTTNEHFSVGLVSIQPCVYSFLLSTSIYHIRVYKYVRVTKDLICFPFSLSNTQTHARAHTHTLPNVSLYICMCTYITRVRDCKDIRRVRVFTPYIMFVHEARVNT